jgi:glycosyltransferase involved in cell wall biosynthesis
VGIARSLEEVGFSVQFFSGHPPPGPLPIRLQVVRSRFVSFRSKPMQMRVSSVISPSLIPKLIRYRPDAILAIEYSMATVWSAIAARLKRAPLIIFQENAHPANAPPSRKRLTYRRVVAHVADVVLANTTSAEREIREGLRVAGTKVQRVHLLCPPLREEMMRDKLDLNGPNTRPLFLFAGRLIPQKNVQTLLRAAHMLKTSGQTFSVWIVGDGQLRANLASSAARLGLDDTVSFLGAVEYGRIGWVYDMADIFVMPSFIEYRSVAVLEAMRFGKPILDSAFDGNVGDTVLPGQNGLVFDPRSPGELAECMTRLIENTDLVKRMGKVSQDLMKNLTSTEGAAQLYRLVKEIT